MPPKRPRGQGLISRHLPDSTNINEDDILDPALIDINKLRYDGHATAVNRRKQYSKEFKLAPISYWREQSKPSPGPGLKIAKNLSELESEDEGERGYEVGQLGVTSHTIILGEEIV